VPDLQLIINQVIMPDAFAGCTISAQPSSVFAHFHWLHGCKTLQLKAYDIGTGIEACWFCFHA